jgi:class 3 adenylate cyclase/predicted ATPase
MPRSIEQLEQAIAALQAQRAVLGDAVVDIALATLQAELAVLHGTAEPTQRLNLVSVLFLDVVGSTALSRELDPEDVQAVMDQALAAFTGIVDQHGGRVLQYAGDSLLAAFGADEVHEDDAERAVLAGLALLHQAQQERARVQAAHGHDNFGVRVGIHSGSVLIGGGVEGEHSIRGSAVNIAARMEQTAPPGALRISHETWHLVRGLFDCEEQAPLRVKGRSDPMLTYLVRAALVSPASEARRGVAGVRVPLVSRDAELARLHAACDGAAAGHSGLVVATVFAEAGLGKTRLLEEFAAGLAERWPGAVRWHAQAAERRRQQPYGLLRELFLARLGLSAIDELAHARQVWLGAAEPVLAHRGSAAVLGHLLGLDFADEPEVQALAGDARALRDRAFFHAVQWLAAAATAATPLVVSLDDLHWADDGSLAFVDHLLQRQSELPVLLLLLTRPRVFERRPAWRTASGPQRQLMEIQPLDASSSRQLALALLQRLPEVPEQLAQVLAGGAEGNPFFMEELVNMLIDQGVIELNRGAGSASWSLHLPGLSGLSGLQLPATLTGVIQARLGTLPHGHRRALQLAAVAGPVFWDQALQVLDMLAVAALGELAARELIRPHEQSRLFGAHEYEFRHHSLHRVAYEGVLKRIKLKAHATLARWLDAQPGREALQDQVAEHHERAGEPEPALRAWQAAAESAQARFAGTEALEHVRRALALADENDFSRRLALLLVRVRALATRAERPQQERTLDEMHGLAEALGDTGWRSEVAIWRSTFHYSGGDALAALDSAQRALALAPEGDSRRRAHALHRAFVALNRLGWHSQAQDTAQQALAQARQGGHLQFEANTLNEMGLSAFGRGELRAAAAHLNDALALHRRTGHLGNVGGTLSNLAFIAMAVGDYDTARQQFEVAREQSARVGQQQNVGIVEINLGIVHLHLGQAEPARAHALHALGLLRASGDRWAEAAALRVAGQAEEALGLAEQARTRYEASRDLFDELQLGHLALEALAALAEEALARGAVAEALGHAQAMLARQAAGAGLAGTDEPLRIPLAIWRALQAAGDPRAPQALADAQRELLSRAAQLADATQREQFLQRVPHHRQIMAAAQVAT